MPFRIRGRGGNLTAATLAVVAMLAAAFVAGVVVGSAQAVAGRAESPVDTVNPPSTPPWTGDLADERISWSPATPLRTSEELDDLPTCTFADLRSHGDPWRRWNAVILDTSVALRPSDVPTDLVDTAQAGLKGGHLVRAIVIDDLRAMARAARRAGAGLAIQSAYRSYSEQASTFAYWVAAVGRHEALRRSARAGHSEHQLGTTIDFTSRGAPPWTPDDWARTDAGAWLLRHAWQYGFVLSYPRGARDVTCYGYEPWHYRYVGPTVASAIHRSGMAPRAWLLRHAVN